MRKSAQKTVAPPRREAAPLGFSSLTKDQRKAGLEIASALRRIAAEPWPENTVPLREHSYLPHLDRVRTNRLLLIDGGRGTGKSTLLLTLLDAYRRNVLGEPTPQEFGRMAERIIPVGLLDLQPLPPSTNLALHVLGHLKSVVDAVEPPSSNVSSMPPWDEPTSNRLRDKWSRLMRLLATWDESLEARVGRQDAGAYIVEIVEDELERGMLSEGFRDAVDALVKGYAATFALGSGKPPLFLVSIDDADMNPRLSARLLELLRKLWHPRLVFLMAGDSRLFQLRLKEALLAQGGRVSTNKLQYQRLASDIYTKDIPSSARFLLGALRPDERVKRNRQIFSLLHRFTLDVHSPEIPRKDANAPPSLRDYFLANLQASELLPDRLRQIDELTARLRRESPPGEERIPASGTLQIVKWLWDETVTERFKNKERRTQLLGAVKSALLDGQLRLDTRRIQLRPELEPIKRLPAAENMYTLTLQVMNRFDAFTFTRRGTIEGSLSGYLSLEPNVRDEHELPKSLTACWILATDITADSTRVAPTEAPDASIDKSSVRFVVASRPAYNLEPMLEVPWPLPAWQAPVDYVLFSINWRKQLTQGLPAQGLEVGLLARRFLWLIVEICLHRTKNAQLAWDKTPSWQSLGKEIAKIAAPESPASSRQMQNASWAIADAPLLAAPESGLPSEEADVFLHSLQDSLGTLWSDEKVRTQRLARLAGMKDSDNQRIDPARALDQVDGAVPTHPFVQAFKDAPPRSDRRGSHRSVWDEVGYLPFPPHSEIFKEKDYSLSRYQTNLRRKSLDSLPDILLSDLNELSQRRDSLSSAPLILINIWKKFAERTGRPDIKPWFTLEQTKLKMSTEAKDCGSVLQKSILGSRGNRISTIQIDASRQLIIEQFAAPETSSSNLPKPLEALFRIMFDYIQDQDDDSAPVEAGLQTWPLVSIQFRLTSQHSIHPWPDVRWPSLKEYEDAPASWSKRIEAIDDWLNSDSLPFKPYIADALALSYLKDRVSSASRGNQSSLGDINDLPSKYNEFLVQLKKFPMPPGQRRSARFSQWLKQLPLMATPEAGLSDTIAQAFLAPEFLGDMSPLQLQEMRRIHVLADGIPPGEVDSVLSAIDQMFPQHPWVKFMQTPVEP